MNNINNGKHIDNESTLLSSSPVSEPGETMDLGVSLQDKGKQLSFESEKSLNQIQNLNEAYEYFMKEAKRLEEDTNIDDYKSVMEAKNKLAQVMGSIEKLQCHELDAVSSVHLDSGRSEVLSSRRELNASLDELQDFVAALHAKYEAIPPPQIRSRSSSSNSFKSSDSVSSSDNVSDKSSSDNDDFVKAIGNADSNSSPRSVCESMKDADIDFCELDSDEEKTKTSNQAEKTDNKVRRSDPTQEPMKELVEIQVQAPYMPVPPTCDCLHCTLSTAKFLSSEWQQNVQALAKVKALAEAAVKGLPLLRQSQNMKDKVVDFPCSDSSIKSEPNTVHKEKELTPTEPCTVKSEHNAKNISKHDVEDTKDGSTITTKPLSAGNSEKIQVTEAENKSQPPSEQESSQISLKPKEEIVNVPQKLAVHKPLNTQLGPQAIKKKQDDSMNPTESTEEKATPNEQSNNKKKATVRSSSATATTPLEVHTGSSTSSPEKVHWHRGFLTPQKRKQGLLNVDTKSQKSKAKTNDSAKSPTNNIQDNKDRVKPPEANIPDNTSEKPKPDHMKNGKEKQCENNKKEFGSAQSPTNNIQDNMDKVKPPETNIPDNTSEKPKPDHMKGGKEEQCKNSKKESLEKVQTATTGQPSHRIVTETIGEDKHETQLKSEHVPSLKQEKTDQVCDCAHCRLAAAGIMTPQGILHALALLAHTKSKPNDQEKSQQEEAVTDATAGVTDTTAGPNKNVQSVPKKNKDEQKINVKEKRVTFQEEIPRTTDSLAAAGIQEQQEKQSMTFMDELPAQSGISTTQPQGQACDCVLCRFVAAGFMAPQNNFPAQTLANDQASVQPHLATLSKEINQNYTPMPVKMDQYEARNNTHGEQFPSTSMNDCCCEGGHCGLAARAVMGHSLLQNRAQSAEPQVKPKPEVDMKAQAMTRAHEHVKAHAEEIARAHLQAKAETEVKTYAEAIARAHLQAKAHADEIARAHLQAKAEAEVKAQAEAIARAHLQAKTEAEAKAHAEAIARAHLQAKAEAEAKAHAEAIARAHLQARAKAEAKAHLESFGRVYTQDANAKGGRDARTQSHLQSLANTQVQDQALADVRSRNTWYQRATPFPCDIRQPWPADKYSAFDFCEEGGRHFLHEQELKERMNLAQEQEKRRRMFDEKRIRNYERQLQQQQPLEQQWHQQQQQPYHPLRLSRGQPNSNRFMGGLFCI